MSFGGVAGSAAVALGAWGAHGLREQLAVPMLSAFETAAQYHLVHALALVLTGSLLQGRPESLWLKLAGGMFVSGILFFSGGLYLLSAAGWGGVGMVVPFGGLALMSGWLFLAAGTLTGR